MLRFIFVSILMVAFNAHAISEEKILQVSYLKQEKNLCVPTCAAMVLAYYSKPISAREIKMWSKGQVYRSKDLFDDFTQTFFDQLISGLKTHDIIWQKKIFSNDDDGFLSGVKELKNQIDQDRPVIIDTSLSKNGHTLIISGYKQNATVFVATDPNIEKPGVREFSLVDLKRIWNSKLTGANDRGAILTNSGKFSLKK